MVRVVPPPDDEKSWSPHQPCIGRPAANPFNKDSLLQLLPRAGRRMMCTETLCLDQLTSCRSFRKWWLGRRFLTHAQYAPFGWSTVGCWPELTNINLRCKEPSPN